MRLNYEVEKKPLMILFYSDKQKTEKCCMYLHLHSAPLSLYFIAPPVAAITAGIFLHPLFISGNSFFVHFVFAKIVQGQSDVSDVICEYGVLGLTADCQV